MFFNTGVIFHEVDLPDELPDVISSFVIVKDEQGRSVSVRVAAEGEEPDVDISAVEHLDELSGRWLPFPYQLSCMHCVQIYLARGDQTRLLMAIDTREAPGANGRALDRSIDADRPYPPLSTAGAGPFLEHPETREFLRELERQGIERAAFKVAALLDLIAPLMPRMRLAPIESHQPVGVSLVLDFGNSRSTALLVESKDGEMSSLPLEVRDSSNPFTTSRGTIGSRITFYPSPFDPQIHDVAVADCFAEPSIARLGREALDRALETPHRYLCSLSGPKRYLWDDAPTDQRWHFAIKKGEEYAPIAGRILKYLEDGSGGLLLREDGPSTPADPRYPSRTMMLFAMVELISQALSQVNSMPYRTFHGREQNPRVLEQLVLTYPSAMSDEEKAVYEQLVQNAVVLSGYLYNIQVDHRPNYNAATESYTPFLKFDEALSAQMVYLYQEVVHAYSGNMAEFVRVYGHEDGTVRIASVDIGGGTADVMVAEYKDKLPGTGTALSIEKLFQDGVSVAGDDVCRALLEDIIFEQVLAQLPSAKGRQQLMQLFGPGHGGHGADWRTLKAKLVPYFWLPLARCFWALGEGFRMPEHTLERQYSVQEVFRIFENTDWSERILTEADAFLGREVPGFMGLNNLFFRFDKSEVEASIDKVLREPLRRYADILAQFDIDILVLAGRTSKLERVRELFVAEMPVTSPRIKCMSEYRVGDWYPAAWREHGFVRDPKSTVAAGATVLQLASRNRLPGLLLDEVTELEQRPIYGLYQPTEPHIARKNELFRDGDLSQPFAYTGGMMVGFRNVDSQEMDGSPLYEVRPANEDVERALLEDRVSLRFRLGEHDRVEIAEAISGKGHYSFEPKDFVLALKTSTFDRYWLDSGVIRGHRRHLFEADEEEAP